MVAATVSEYRVDDFAGLVGELHLNKVIILPWEWCGEVIDPLTWIETLAKLCELHVIDAWFVTVPEKDLTIVWNAAANPSDEFVQQCVRRIELMRWLELTLPSKEEYYLRAQGVPRLVP